MTLSLVLVLTFVLEPVDLSVTGASATGTVKLTILPTPIPPAPPGVPSTAGGRPAGPGVAEICNYNFICEPLRGETIENCPTDCLIPEILVFYIGNLDIKSEYIYRPEIGEEWMYTYLNTNRTLTILEKAEDYLYIEHKEPGKIFTIGVEERIDIDIDEDGKNDVFLYLEKFDGVESVLILGLTEEFFRVVRFRYVDIWTIIVFIMLISITTLLIIGYKKRRGPGSRELIR